MRFARDPPTLEGLSRDAGVIRMLPEVACFASTEGEVEAALARAQADGVSVTPRGGGTSIPSQSIGRGMVLLQERNRTQILPGGEVRCEPGLVKADLNRALEGSARWMPVDPSSYTSCTIGGMVANNSSGIRTPKYGSVIDYVSNVRAVIPGEATKSLGPMPIDEAASLGGWAERVADLLLDNAQAIAQETPRVTKNSSGYRLERVMHDGLFDPAMLMVGSEGTLGVVTEAVLRTAPRPKWRTLLVVESSLEELDEIAASFREHSPSALELVDKSVFQRVGREDRVAKYSRSDDDYLVFCEIEGNDGEPDDKISEVAASKSGGYDPMVIQGAGEISEAWEARNETLRLAQDIRKEGRVLVPGVEDLVVPPTRLGELVRLLKDQFEGRGLEYISYGHAGDANLHARPMLDLGRPSDARIHEEVMEECFSEVWKMGGSMTGEHGDGMIRAKYLQGQYPKTYPVMKEIKAAIDPRGALCPGVKVV